MGVENIQARYDRLVWDKVNQTKNIQQQNKKIKRLKKEIQLYSESQDILNNSIEIIHRKFKLDVENTITKAIKQVFERDISIELAHDKKRSNLETRIIIKENGENHEPKDDLCGSIIDIISLCFRIIHWKMTSTRNVFILDEPFKWTGKLAGVTGIILKELSKKLNFQVILNTHDNALMDIADRTFKVKNINGISQVKTIHKRIV